MADSTETRVRDVFSQVCPLPADAKPQLKLESLGMDSLDLVELVQELEEEFDVTIDDDRAETMAKGTLGDVVNYMDELLS